jgi:hypothetical protein
MGRFPIIYMLLREFIYQQLYEDPGKRLQKQSSSSLLFYQIDEGRLDYGAQLDYIIFIREEMLTLNAPNVGT